MAGKFNLKNLHTGSDEIRKKIQSDIENTAKNREKETPQQKVKIPEELKEKPIEHEKQKITVPKVEGYKTISVTLPDDVKNFLRIKPRLEKKQVTDFLHDIIAEKQKEYEEAGIDVKAPPDYSAISTMKQRANGSNASAYAIRLSTEQHEWIKLAAIQKGMNQSQFLEWIIRKEMG